MLPLRIIPFSNLLTQRRTAPVNPISIVQVSRDQELSRLRAKVLVSAGHLVRSIAPEESTAESKVPGPERVWVFCHTLEFYELALMAVAIRRIRPADKLLRLTGLEDVNQVPGLFDGFLDPVEGVEELLQAVAHLSTPE
jgi:hypothetical protein